MKATIFHSVFCTFLLAFTIGCGKENKSGGGGGVPNAGGFINPIINPGMDQSSQTNLNEIQTWYKNAEPATLKPFSRLSRAITSQQNSLNCSGETKKLFGLIEICLHAEISMGDSAAVQGNFLVGTSGTNLVANPLMCKTESLLNMNRSCIEGTQTTYPGKAQNIKLSEALSGRSNTLSLLNVTKLPGSSTVYQLVYANSTLESQPSVIYTIDTKLHSLYNPVEIVDLKAAAPTQEWVQLFN